MGEKVARALEKFKEVQETIKKLMAEALQEVLEAEMEEFLGYAKYERGEKNNYRNGYSSKTLKTSLGEIEIKTPRDRNSDFEPQIVKKRQMVLGELEDKIISLYAKGMSTRDIQELFEEIYGKGVSSSLISRITERLEPRIKEWQNRPLEKVYVILFIDCIFYKVRDNGKVKDKAIYVVAGINREGKKEVLGFWISETESSSFWINVLNDLKARRVEDVLIFCVDNLSGISKAIKAVYPKAEIQKCVVHQIRNSLKYVSWKDRKEIANDLKKIYQAATLDEAEYQLEEFEKKWVSKYPHVVKNWRTNWEELTTYFRYPYEMRKIMYTTNIIESINSAFRRVTDKKRVFPSDEALLKNLYLAIERLEKKWERSKVKNWSIIYGQLSEIFKERLEV